MSSPQPYPSLLTSLKIQMRVVFALTMREIITRYGRHNIGFAWLFAEPMLFTVGIAALWNLLHETGQGHEINVTAFAVTSYSTVLVWRNTIGRCTLAVEPNAALLFHRNVRVIDLFFARITLEIVGTTLSMLVLTSTLIAIGIIDPPADVLNMAAGWVLLCWYSAALGLLIGGLCEYSELVERLWHPISYFQLPVSGAFVMASWLPPNLRDIAMLFPAPNCVELFRYGYFGSQITPYYDVPYTIMVCAFLTWIGLAVVRDVSTRVEH
ncbi:ABC transporter permease [Burkholderia orbicola]|uniref:ABC-2 type transporter n=1 Tax=Burkholderia orbicola (strain MC0-3) TaxID=406425 RepID=B1JWF0_BURO0|nr:MULTISPECIES: ABC transporter permease [Burkholderia]EKS9844216.1 ABC transporter permease [Burkholderia cepacia]ACA89924.1 ABC-2 type transporter [Burkholderia orbicola MC0-3]MBJ9667277.1 ABC transporter permease [Burkholderia cenocepacia]MBL3964363.1 ABC transporter permease [Burkholderia sp. KCJ3K979]MBR8395372.1 ABC transporter permease [Burkholderia cenocepacia]